MKDISEMNRVFQTVMQRETLNCAKVNDIPVTAVHMEQVEDYGFYTKDDEHGL